MQATDGPFNGVVPGLAVSDVSEDCLTLNVWTPGEPGDDLPVLVWVYGGAFVVGGYQFAWQSHHAEREMGSFHAIDLPFAFDTFDGTGWAEFLGIDDGGRAVGRMLRDAWAAFAATGNPSCPALGTWPAYDTTRRPTMILDAEPAVVDDPLAAERAWWDGLWSPACLPPAVPI